MRGTQGSTPAREAGVWRSYTSVPYGDEGTDPLEISCVKADGCPLICLGSVGDVVERTSHQKAGNKNPPVAGRP